MADVFFDSLDSLIARLRLWDDVDLWRRPTRRLELRGPEPSAPTAWLLQLDGRVPTGPTGSMAPVTLAGDTVQVGPAAVPYTVVARRAAPSLLQAVPLRPGLEVMPADAPSYLLLATPALFESVTVANLMLGNDRLAYLPLGNGLALLRVEGLNAFLAQKWAAEPGLRRYLPSAVEPRLLLPAGWVYPLADKLKRVAPGEDELWLLGQSEPWRRLRGEFRDIYERLSVDTSSFGVATLSARDDVPRVRVALRLQAVDDAPAPTAWHLAAEEQPALERLLAEASEDTLSNLQLAYLRGPGERETYLLLERNPAAHRLPPPVAGGRPFYAWLPDERFYLPAGTRLVPYLSRRSLVQALGLAGDHLTLIEPAAEGLSLLRVPAATLQPAVSLVDHWAGRARDDVHALIEHVTFDWNAVGPADERAAGGWTTWLRRWWRR